MRREAGLAVLVLVGALAIPIATATPVAAQPSPTLTNIGATSGGVGTPLKYSYVWDDPTDCAQVVLGDPTTQVVLSWDNPPLSVGQAAISPDGSGCSGTVTGTVPGFNMSTGPHTLTAQLEDSAGTGVGGGEAFAVDSFTVPVPTPTPQPTPRPTPKPTPRPTPTQAPTATPKPTPPPTPTPKPLPTPPPFIGGGGGGGSGGGSPEGGAACSGGIGRSPTSTELSGDIAQIVQGTDPTTVQIGLLASDEYYQDAGGTDLDFVNRLYDDVLRHDPTPVEVSIGLSMLAGAGEAGRSQLAEAVVLSPEARAIRVDQAFHTLLDTYPSSAELAIWVNRLAGVGTKGISDNTMVEEVAASGAFFTLVGSKGATFIDKLYQALLSRSPTATELKDDASLIASAASVSSRLALAEKVVSSTEFLSDQVISFYANYLHHTCPEILAQECAGVPGTPSSAELSAALTALAGTSTEEDIIAGVLARPQYYANHGSTQTGLVDGIYQDLFGRAPTNAEVSAALDKYPNDPLGDSEFVQSMVSSSVYMDLVVSLDYQQFLLRAPLPTETTAGAGVLGGDVPSLQTPDQTLLEQIVATPEYLADTGGTPSRFVVRTIETLLVQAPSTEQTLSYLSEPLPHTSSWQSGVVTSIVDSPMYETDFVRGVYAKFLTYTLCPVTGPVTTRTGDIGFLKEVPGGWFGLGVMVGVLLMGAGAAAFFTLERRRFSRIYPDEVPRHHL